MRMIYVLFVEIFGNLWLHSCTVNCCITMYHDQESMEAEKEALDYGIIVMKVGLILLDASCQ